jgi:hypothetical protein
MARMKGFPLGCYLDANDSPMFLTILLLAGTRERFSEFPEKDRPYLTDAGGSPTHVSLSVELTRPLRGARKEATSCERL